MRTRSATRAMNAVQVLMHEGWLDVCDAVDKRSPALARLLRRVTVDAPAVVCYALVCFLVFVADCARPGVAVSLACRPMLAYQYESPVKSALRLVSHTVAHGNWAHLRGNMVNLLLVGPSAEREFGTKNLLRIGAYVGVASAAAHAALGPADAVQLGASGVVFALILLNSLLSAHAGCVPLTFLLTAFLWVSDEVLSLFAKDGVSHIAHLSGALVGTAAGYHIHADRAKLRAAEAARAWYKLTKQHN
mmetsp:Transcript_14958/g.44671  ORF Transcript_14958/g.44671 Transcript_14958/m.44671 type:complete len:247 (+) Transcript_14958:367-1107(+)